MKNKEKYDIRELIFNVLRSKNGNVKAIDIYHHSNRIEKIKFLSFEHIETAINAIGSWLEEYKPTILTEKEKAYLSAVIKPFREKVKYIVKFKRYSDKKEYLYMTMKKDDDYCTLPVFEKGTMYKGMEADKKYTLEELGL